MRPPTRIGFVLGLEGPETLPLFRALSDLFPMEFVPLAEAGNEALDALVLMRSSREAARRVAERGLPCLAFCSGNEGGARAIAPSIEFAESSAAPLPLRGQQLWEGNAAPWPCLVLEAGETVVCTRGGANLWLRRTYGPAFYSLTSVQPPELKTNGYLQSHFRAGSFMRLLPLLAFLKEVTADGAWPPPPPRACVIFDDPSLWSRRYGFLDFARLADHARGHGYHAAIAMVPLGSSLSGCATVSLFRERPDHVSLVVHGNNHSSRELAQHAGCDAQLGQLAQALERIEHFEQKFGARVCRVMEPPHGVWRREYLPALHRLGFEGTLATTELLLANHAPGELPTTFGLALADLVADAAPLLPRIRLTPAWRTDVLLAAFLDRPIVVAAHHKDLAEGPEFLEELVSTVGRLPGARWMNPSDILRSHYQTRQDDERLRVRMLSRAVRVRIPKGTRELVVERPWLATDEEAPLRLQSASGGGSRTIDASAVSDPLPVDAGEEFEIASPSRDAIDWRTVPRPRTPMRAVARRALMEIRDRSYPWRYRYRWLRREPPLKAGY